MFVVSCELYGKWATLSGVVIEGFGGDSILVGKQEQYLETMVELEGLTKKSRKQLSFQIGFTVDVRSEPQGMLSFPYTYFDCDQ